ncbi:hypothetical protein CAPTEDRAFT_222380 [Capitella teleta]|uniref:Gamma-aminobutyric acid type B receptor subunit 2 n=1 Tax=Capitella teleta TaxID=283909 RepID=R7T8Z6_CAPTE|nr:hypothetical protein CAPTEDRAFT_222380 [Capitella teleta]|eukprot:ELT87875.1 hypothetical protein CAPTEDRAFT_222380 [Capitella teleta]
MAVGTKLFFDMMHEPPAKVMLFGDACSEVTTPIAESAKWWNIWQLSYGDTDPLLSNRKTYPNFFRTVPSDCDHIPARLAILKAFDWSHVGTIFQDASWGSTRHSYAHGVMAALFDQHDIHMNTESFSADPLQALKRMKDKDSRIIIGNFDESMAKKVFCAAHAEDMYGPRYQWVIPGDYSENWWRSAVECSQKHLEEVLEGHFATDVLGLSTDGVRTIGGRTAEEYHQLYEDTRKRANAPYSKFHGYAYDGIWVIARAIDSLVRQNQGRFDLEDFRNDRLHATLNDTNFVGVTGPVLFSNGDRIGGIVIKQFQGGQMVKVGEFDSQKLDFTKGEAIVWKGSGQPPQDKTTTVHELQKVNLTIYVVMCSFSGLGIIIALTFLAINIRFRRHRYIKMSSPNMNNLIIMGCVFAYTSVFLLGADGGLVPPHHYAILCSGRTWIMCVGFTLSFGAMFSKTWRVHAIFTNIKLNKKVIKDYKLFLLVAFLLFIDIVILSAWQIFDPPERETKNLRARIDPREMDVEILPVMEFCISRHMTIWLISIYVYKGLLLVFGCFLAWETRQVSIAALNDSKYIGMSVYNVVIMCVSGVPVTFIIKDRPDAAYLIIALFITFSTTITLCLVFMPKIVQLKRDPNGEEKRIRATLRKTMLRHDDSSEMAAKITQLSQENSRFKQILENKKLELQELLLQLGENALINPETFVHSDPVIFGKNPQRNSSHARIEPFVADCFIADSLCSGDPSLDSSSNTWLNDKPNTWSLDPNHRGPQQARSMDWIELAKMQDGKPTWHDGHRAVSGPISHTRAKKKHRVGFDIEAEDSSASEALLTHNGTPPTYEEAVAASSLAPAAMFSTGARTPSYQGLKFLNDIFSLKETAILSDSDPEKSASPSIQSLPGMHLPAIAIEKRRRQPERLLDVPSRGLRSTKTSSPSRIHPKRRVAAGRFQESFPQSAGSLPSTPVDVHACDVLQYI